MKNFLIIFLSIIYLNSFSQNIEEKFHNKTWHSNGDMMRSQTFTLSTEPVLNLTDDLEFLSEGNLDITLKPQDLKVIFQYEFLNDKLKVYSVVTFTGTNERQESANYYKIKELNNNKTFELTQIKEAEYK